MVMNPLCFANPVEKMSHLWKVALFLLTITLVTNLDVMASKTIIDLPYYLYLGIAVIFAMVSVHYCHRFNCSISKPRILVLGLLGICWLILEVVFFWLKKDLGPTPLFKAHIISCLIFFGFTLTFQNPLFVKSAYYGIVIGVILGALLCLIQVFFPTFLTDWPPPRSSGFSGNPNAAAFAITFGFFATIWGVLEKYRIYFAALCLAGVVATMSRTLLAAFVAGIICLMLFELFRVTAWRKQCGVAVCALSVFFVIAYEVNPIFRFGIDGQFLNIPQSLFYYAHRDHYYEEMAKNTTYKDYDKLSAIVRLDGAKRAVRQLPETTSVGMPDLNQASENSGHNAYLYYRLSYGLIGYLVLPVFLFMITIVGKSRAVIPFGVAMMIAALGYQDLLSSWGALIVPSALLVSLKASHLV